MKKWLVLIFSSMIVFLSFSQKRCEYPACREDFLKNKLYVVQTESVRFDSALKVAMTEEWTVSPIGGYITTKELKQMRKSTENSFLQPAKFTWYVARSGNMNNERRAVLLGFFRGYTVYPTLNQLELESMEFLEGYFDVQFDTSIYRLKLIIRGRNNYYKYANSIDSINKKYTLGLLKKKILLINERYRHDKKNKKRFV